MKLDVFKERFLRLGNTGIIFEAAIIEAFEDHYDQKFTDFLKERDLEVFYDEDDGYYYFWPKHEVAPSVIMKSNEHCFKQILPFIKWYSGMEEHKIINAWKRYIKEKAQTQAHT